jgi:pyrroloquinoline quinone biosynthesis protein B
MRVLVLGSGIASGFPGWNEGHSAARSARAHDPNHPRREGAALALSGDGHRYTILDAPFHLASTLTRTHRFAPAEETRSVPLDTLVLSSAELDACVGVIALRSGLSARIASPRAVRAELVDHNAAFRTLEPLWSDFASDYAFPLDRSGRLEARFFPLRGQTEPTKSTTPHDATLRGRCGVRVTDSVTGTRLVWAPRIARFDSATLAELRAADLRFIDGTFYQDAEARTMAPRARQAVDLGHVPIDGESGSLALLAGMTGESFYVHMAGSNPLCNVKSEASERVRAAGVEIAFDGLEFER